MPLTARQKIFCAEYVIDFNASAAARRAGYAKDSAGTEGNRLLQSAEIMACVGEVITGRVKKATMTADDITARLEAMAAADPADIYDEQGHSKLPHEIDEQTRLLIEEIYWTETGIRYKLCPSEKILKMLGERLAMFQQVTKTQHSGSVGLVTEFKPTNANDASREYQKLIGAA